MDFVPGRHLKFCGVIVFVFVSAFSVFSIYPTAGFAWWIDQEVETEQQTAILGGPSAILSWNTFGNAGTETSEASVFNHPNVSAANLVLGAGVTPSANGNRLGGTTWFDSGDTNPTTLTESVAGNDYIQFTVTPQVNHTFSPTTFVFSWDRSNTGPPSLTLRSSVDSYFGDIATVTGSPAAITSQTMTFLGSPTYSGPITFRLYGYGATATGGSGGFDTSTSVVNVQLNGTVDPIPVISLDNTSASFGTTAVNANSAIQSRPITGSGLTGNISCVADPTFQVSSDGVNFGSGATFTQSGGTVNGTLRVRHSPTGEFNYDGFVSCGSSGAAGRSFYVDGSGVYPKYRYGTIWWERDTFNQPLNAFTVDINAEAGFRSSDFGSPVVNQQIDLGIDFDFGDGVVQDARFRVTQVAPSLDIMYGQFFHAQCNPNDPNQHPSLCQRLRHTYPASPTMTYTAFLQGNRRLPSVINFGANDWRSEVIVSTDPAVTKSPRSLAPAVISLQDDTVNQFQIFHNAFDNTTTIVPFGTEADFLATASNPTGQVKPVGVTTDGFGVFTWDIRNSVQPSVVPGQFHTLAVMITQSNGVTTPLDILIRVEPPITTVATTLTATNITTTSATLNGTINPGGVSANGTFSTTGGSLSGSPQFVGNGNTAVPISRQLNNLTPNTLYCFQAVATTVDGQTILSIGANQCFATPGPPESVTNEPTNITSNSVTLRGNVWAQGLETTAYFRYSTTNPGSCNDTFGTQTTPVILAAGSPGTALDHPLSLLNASTMHYYCTVATNSAGTSFGQLRNFQTLGPTAAAVSVSGRVLTAEGNGIGNASVVIANQSGVEFVTRSNPFGYYRVENIPAGSTYVLRTSSKRYSFSERILILTDSIADLDIVANSWFANSAN